MVRALVVLWLFVTSVGVVRAETVALLPLDGEKRLEIYGQPVAAELARAMKDAGIDVVVVGAKMAVPDRAQLIVDGTIKGGKGDAITLSIRIRDPKNGTSLEALPPSTATLTTIDRAAAELSARVVPAVKTHLAALARPVAPPHDGATLPPVTPPVTPPGPVAAPASLPVVLTSVSAPRPSQPALDLLARGISDELAGWARTHGRQAQVVDGEQLSRGRGLQAVAAAGANVGVALEVISFTVEPGAIPLARARVRVRIIDGTTIRFERVIRTDTVVGDRDITELALAARTGREVLAIANAQLRRLIPGWR